MPQNDSGFMFLDGALGTMLQAHGLEPGGRPDIMNITAPEAVENVHRLYYEAGSEVLYTNTFGANTIALRGTGYSPEEIITAAVSLAKRACGGEAAVALDIGPLGGLIEPLGEMTFDAAYDMFKEQAAAGETAGADLAAIETMSDLTELKAAIMAIRENTKLPVITTMTFDKSGRTFTGCLPESFAIMAERLGVTALGINCSLEPSEMLPIAERLAKMTSLPLVVKPNAGLPDSATGLYGITPAEFARQMAEFARLGARIVGGCCGTTPEYITELRKTYGGLEPGNTEKETGTFICTPTCYESLSGFVPSGRRIYTMHSKELDDISVQLLSGAGIIELRLPDGAAGAAKLVTETREMTDKPMVFVADDAEALDSALRTAGGVAAVLLTGRGADELIKTAAKYGAVIL